MKFSLKKKNLKVLKSADINTNNILALGQTKMVNGASTLSGDFTSVNIPKDPDVQIPASVIVLTDMVK